MESRKEIITRHAKKHGKKDLSAFIVGMVDAVTEHDVSPSERLDDIKEIILAYDEIMDDESIQMGK